ncbi:hypothetical protein NDM229_012235 [Acinetobacter bereziniae]|nr:hypothetical protein NDM229_012235 [Acinetobacter bereziniae]
MSYFPEMTEIFYGMRALFVFIQNDDGFKAILFCWIDRRMICIKDDLKNKKLIKYDSMSYRK